jgi:hypothetical protein
MVDPKAVTEQINTQEVLEDGADINLKCNHNHRPFLISI